MFNQLSVTAHHAMVERAAYLIQNADSMIVAAGAGMGVDSGLPDFRGDTGFWNEYPALREAKISFTSIASPTAFQRTPDRAWGFYGHRLELYRETNPHAGFGLLKHWGEQMAQGYRVFTSNVDGQFKKAGFEDEYIYECHGSIHHLQCLESCNNTVWDANGFKPDVDQKQCRLRNTAPTCPICGGLARPNILMFNDWGWVDKRSEDQNSRFEAWLTTVKRPIVIELGAGTAIPSIREFSQSIIKHSGGRLIRINPLESSVPSDLEVGLAMGAAEGLAAIEQVLNQSLPL